VSKRKRRWTREFKLAAVARMETAETVTGLAAELGICRELLHKWRRAHEAGGAAALQPLGRPSLASKPLEEPRALPPEDLAAAQRRIEALERKIGQQQLDLDFFRAALRHVRERRLKKGVPGETASTR
jgi:transposase